MSKIWHYTDREKVDKVEGSNIIKSMELYEYDTTYPISFTDNPTAFLPLFAGDSLIYDRFRHVQHVPIDHIVGKREGFWVSEDSELDTESGDYYLGVIYGFNANEIELLYPTTKIHYSYEFFRGNEFLVRHVVRGMYEDGLEYDRDELEPVLMDFKLESEVAVHAPTGEGVPLDLCSDKYYVYFSHSA